MRDRERDRVREGGMRAGIKRRKGKKRGEKTDFPKLLHKKGLIQKSHRDFELSPRVSPELPTASLMAR